MGRPRGSRNKPKGTPAPDPGPGTELARVDYKDVVGYLNERKNALHGYAIRQYKIDEFLRGALIAVTDNSRLRNALKTRAGQSSLYNALKYAASTGLSLNPQQGKAALVPYHNQNGDLVVNYQIMKGGLIDLVMETGQVNDLVADLVREKDVFALERTAANDSYRFAPARKDRGNIDGYFAAVTLKSGRTHVNYMSIEEVKEHEQKYNSSKKLGERSPWSHSFDGMAIKTVIKKLLRNLHLSPETGAAIAVDDESEFSSDIIEGEGEPMEPTPEPEAKPEPESPPDPPADKPGASDVTERGDTAEDVAAKLAASDAAADEQAETDNEGDSDPDDSAI